MLLNAYDFSLVMRVDLLIYKRFLDELKNLQFILLFVSLFQFFLIIKLKKFII